MDLSAEQHTEKTPLQVHRGAREAASGPGAFYAEALAAADRAIYRRACATRGLEGEIALLRLSLHTLLREGAAAAAPADGQAARSDPARQAQMLRLIDLLVKALRAQGHASADEEEQRALERVLDEESLHLLHAAMRT